MLPKFISARDVLEGLFGLFAVGDVLRENDDSTDVSILLVPGQNLPAQPIYPPVQPGEWILLTLLARAREAPWCTAFHRSGCRGKYLVVAPANDLLIAQAVIGGSIDGQLATYVMVIKHRDIGRRMFDEES